MVWSMMYETEVKNTAYAICLKKKQKNFAYLSITIKIYCFQLVQIRIIKLKLEKHCKTLATLCAYKIKTKLMKYWKKYCVRMVPTLDDGTNDGK